MRNILIASIGHTAAGKTTLLKYLAEHLNINYISEGSIKRSLVGAYESKDSLDENLRDRAYKIAIKEAVKHISLHNNVILDASFHRQYRRLWIYEEASRQQKNPLFIWLFCHCNNALKVKSRISQRTESSMKFADNQADKFYIYEHIISEFDGVSQEFFPNCYDTVIIEIDTDANKIINICGDLSQCDKLVKIIQIYLTSKKC